MRKLSIVFVAVLLGGVPGGVAVAEPPAARNFVSPLSGEAEVPPVETKATGNAVYKLDGEVLRFKLIVANIDDVTQAHIHCGASDVAGPVTAFLFGFELVEGTSNGILSQGTITPEDVIPLPDSPVCPGGIEDFDDLIAKMRSGDAYTNVHTVEHPPGEIRGQIRAAGPG